MGRDFRKQLCSIVIISTFTGLSLLACAAYGSMLFGRAGSYDYAPQVRLIEPSGETVDLSGKESLTFKWSWMEGDRLQRQYYDFRIYCGYDMLENTLIFKAQVAPDTYHISVRSGLFADGEVYTWCVRQRYIGLAKSGRSYASFRVIKK